MAREFARLLLAIRDDPSWQALTCIQQAVYSSILASRDLSWAGVAPNLPSRFADWSHELTPAKVRSAMLALTEERLVVVDVETDEVLVRTYIRHDGILSKPNITRAMVKAFHLIHSASLQEVIVEELAGFLVRAQELRGWDQIRQMDAGLWDRISSRPEPPIPGLRAVS